RGADRWVTGEGQLHSRREDAHARRAARRLRLEHEHGLRMAELARDRLHRGIAQSIGVEHDGERITGEPLLGEYIERSERELHESTSPDQIIASDCARGRATGAACA